MRDHLNTSSFGYRLFLYTTPFEIMRTFVSDNGLFELDFPSDWKYELSDDHHIHQFYSVEGIGSFHFSVPNNQVKQTFEEFSIKSKAYEKRIGGIITYEILAKNADEFNTLLWLIKVQDTYFLASYTYSNLPQVQEQFLQELEVIYSIIGSLKVINLSERLEKISA